MLNWIYDCEVVYVMYPYMTFEDGTEVIHSDLITDGDTEKVIVHFERPTAEGFDSARCELPSYSWTMWEGRFTDEEKRGFETFLSNNAHLLYRYAANGGAKVAQPVSYWWLSGLLLVQRSGRANPCSCLQGCTFR